MVVAVVVYWVTPVVLEVPAVAEPVVTGRPLLGCRALRGVVVAVAVTLTQREVTVVLVAPASSSSLGLGPPTQRLSSSPARRRPRSFRRVIGTRRVTVWNVLRVVVVADVKVTPLAWVRLVVVAVVTPEVSIYQGQPTQL